MAAGSCLCGAIRFDWEPRTDEAGVCHCTDCRKVTGSAFNVSVPVEMARFRLTAGAPRSFTKRADSGNDITRHFCPDCGSPLFTTSPTHPDHLFLKAGAIDPPVALRLGSQAWTRSRVTWSIIPPDLPVRPAEH